MKTLKMSTNIILELESKDEDYSQQNIILTNIIIKEKLLMHHFNWNMLFDWNLFDNPKDKVWECWGYFSLKLKKKKGRKHI